MSDIRGETITDDQRREILAHSEYGVSPGQGINAGTFRVIGYSGEVAGGFSSQRDAEDWVIRNALGLESNEPDDDSPELTDDQLSRLRPARGPGEPRVIEADELVVTTRDVEFAIECQRAMKPQRPVWFNGLHFAVQVVEQAGFENRWVLTLARCHQMTGGPYPDVREGTRETFIDVTNENGSGIRVEFRPSQYVAGAMLGEAHVKFVEVPGDPHHGLTDEQWAFFETLQEAFVSGGTLTFDFGGKTYTGVYISELIKEA